MQNSERQKIMDFNQVVFLIGPAHSYFWLRKEKTIAED